jgi:hypothetical protein
MTPTFRIHKPYALAQLPRPISHHAARYHVGEVFGQSPGCKKRKRHELSVGIDGEAANIYDVRLSTSY